jgi:hypothetical protein
MTETTVAKDYTQSNVLKDIVANLPASELNKLRILIGYSETLYKAIDAYEAAVSSTQYEIMKVDAAEGTIFRAAFSPQPGSTQNPKKGVRLDFMKDIPGYTQGKTGSGKTGSDSIFLKGISIDISALRDLFLIKSTLA